MSVLAAIPSILDYCDFMLRLEIRYSKSSNFVIF